jgi:transcriptional regulator
MYLPPHFDTEDRAVGLELMRDHPFASLISNDDDGLPYVSHLPFVVDDRADEGLVLLGHCARPNAHWKYLAARPRAVVTFLGPHAYMSPKVYPDLTRVPTWNYLAVHCTVEARIVDDPEGKDGLLKRLIAQHEPAYAAQWQGLDAQYRSQMLAGMVGFELAVTALQCKVKLNQHRPEAHKAMQAAYAAGTPDERALAGWMKRVFPI